MVNIAEPVELYELGHADLRGWQELKSGYEEALALFEAQMFRQTARILAQLLTEYPDDGPSPVLMARAVHCMVEEPVTFDPVWDVPGK